MRPLKAKRGPATVRSLLKGTGERPCRRRATAIRALVTLSRSAAERAGRSDLTGVDIDDVGVWGDPSSRRSGRRKTSIRARSAPRCPVSSNLRQIRHFSRAALTVMRRFGWFVSFQLRQIQYWNRFSGCECPRGVFGRDCRRCLDSGARQWQADGVWSGEAGGPVLGHPPA